VSACRFCRADYHPTDAGLAPGGATASLSVFALLGLAATGEVEVLAAATLFWLIGCELHSWLAVSFVEPFAAAANVGRLLDAVAGCVPFAEAEMVELVSFGAPGGRIMKADATITALPNRRTFLGRG